MCWMAYVYEDIHTPNSWFPCFREESLKRIVDLDSEILIR